MAHKPKPDGVKKHSLLFTRDKLPTELWELRTDEFGARLKKWISANVDPDYIYDDHHDNRDADSPNIKVFFEEGPNFPQKKVILGLPGRPRK